MRLFSILIYFVLAINTFILCDNSTNCIIDNYFKGVCEKLSLNNEINYTDIIINFKDKILINDTDSLCENNKLNKISSNLESENTNFFKFFDLMRTDGYDIVIIYYLSFIFFFILSLIIFKYNLCLNCVNLKLEIFNYTPTNYIITLAVYVIWWTLMLIYSFLGTNKGEIMIRLGNWITLNLASILFPILRNSILVILFNISHERIIYIHIILSILCIVSVVIKFITAIIFYEPLFLVKIINPSTGGSPLMGTISTILFLIISMFAIPVIRKKNFEVFYYSHKILSVLIIIISSLHYISFLYYIFPAILMYFVDLCIRLYSTNSSIYSKLQNIGSDKYGTSSTFINITFLNKIKTFPGCYYFVCFYKDISRFEWHPLSMVAYENDTIVFCAKNVGQHSWTNRLFNVVNNKIDILTNRKIYIQGPYGHISVNYKNDTYETIIIIAGGIGITPMISILQDINDLYENKKLLRLKKVYFYWIISHISLYDAFKKYFKDLNKNIFEVKIYTTKKFTLNEFEIDYYSSSIENNNESISFINNKPNITYILNMIFSKNNKNTVILTCGPSKLTDEIFMVANRFNINISVELFG